MKKKVIIGLIIGVIICLANGICYGKSNIPDEEYINKFFIDINVLNGYPDGNLRLDNEITREEFSKIIVLASTYKDKLNLLSKSSVFSDVTKERWSSPYIKVAAQNGILKGYPDLTFKPTNNINIEEASTIALRLLNYTSDDYGVSWPYSQINFARKEHILDNVSKNAGENITRKDAINIIYNILCSNINGQNVKYINMLDYTLLDNVVIIASNNQDSSIAVSSVLTSNGKYKLLNKFDDTTIGSNSSIVVNKENEIVGIIPYNQNEKEYNIASIVKNGIIVLKDGSTENIEVDDETLVYYKSQKTTLSKVSSLVSTGDIVHIFYKDSQIEYMLIEKTKYKGPYIIKNNSINEYGISEDAKVLKNNKITKIEDIKTNDVIYYFPDTNQVEVYDVKISGMIENILPNILNASSININGSTYQIGNQDVYNKIQNYEIGKGITLLLGRENEILGILDFDETKLNEIGILLNVGTKKISQNNTEFTKYYAKVLLTNGNTNEYIVDKNYSEKVNQIVRINYSSNGNITLSVLGNRNSVYGLVNTSKNKIGNNSLADDVNILEIPKDNQSYIPVAKKIYLDRLDNVYIGSNNVIYYTKNNDGEVDNLIITDVTNDMYVYGMLLSAIEVSPVSSQTIYKININNTEMTFNSDVRYNVDTKTPVQILIQNNQIIDMNKLTKVNAENILYNKIIIGKEEYTLSSDIPVYIKNDTDEYLTANLQYLIENKEKYTMTAYYDKLETNGGKIRTIIIK